MIVVIPRSEFNALSQYKRIFTFFVVICPVRLIATPLATPGLKRLSVGTESFLSLL